MWARALLPPSMGPPPLELWGRQGPARQGFLAQPPRRRWRAPSGSRPRGPPPQLLPGRPSRLCSSRQLLLLPTGGSHHLHQPQLLLLLAPNQGPSPPASSSTKHYLQGQEPPSRAHPHSGSSSSSRPLTRHRIRRTLGRPAR